MGVAQGSAMVVVSSGSRALGECGEGPPVACVAETFVADLSGFDLAGSARGASDRRCSGERSEIRGAVEAGEVVAHLTQNPRGKD